MDITDEILVNPILRNIQDKFETQTEKGIAKYGNTVQPNNLEIDQWATHAQEELLDNLVYLECLKTRTRHFKENYDHMQDLLKMIIDETISYEDAEMCIISIRGMARSGLDGP